MANIARAPASVVSGFSLGLLVLGSVSGIRAKKKAAGWIPTAW